MFLLILLGLLTAVVFYIKHVYTFWQRKGFPVATEVGGKIPFGALESVVKRQKSFGMAMHDIYENSKERFLGIYLIFRPAILIRDAELARQILTQDFASFHDRGTYCDEKNDPYSGNLFTLPGEKWKALRTKLAPSFTSGKIKAMFGTVTDIGDAMLEYLHENVPQDGTEQVVEMKNVFSRYAIDIIGSSIFGLDMNSFKEPNNPLNKIRTNLTKPTLTSVVRGASVFLFPLVEKIFVRLGVVNPVAEAMKAMVRQTVEYREKNNVHRKDMMQMLIELRNTGKINLDDELWQGQSVAESIKSMSIDTIAGQAFLFYVAGYDSTASAAAFTIFELAKNPDVLKKLMDDIEQTLDKHDGKITYESLQDMKYLDLCISETIRKYTVLPILNRECTADYPIPGSDKVIKKGTPIIIPLFSIHRDPEYFPDPMKYDPERFSEENKNYNPVAFMPFGEGPRHCIAQRMGTVNVKIAVVKFLINYDVASTHDGEIEIDNFAVTITPKGGVKLKLKRRSKVTKE